jgi:hydrophobe/amphiphile efflux-3 (HAE3) family protein
MAARILQAVIDRPRRVLAAAVLLMVAAAFTAGQLEPSAPPSLLAERGSAVATATRSAERTFGAEPIVVVARGELTNTLAAANLNALLDLERRVARLRGVQAVFGPGTFVSQTVEQINRVLARELGPPAERADRAARRAAAAARHAGAGPASAQQTGERARLRALGPLREQYQQLFVRFGYLGLPSLANRTFVQALVLGAGAAPKQRFAWLFPDRTHALVLVRLRDGLSDGEVRAIGAGIERLTGTLHLTGVQTQVAGTPLVAAGITDELSSELLRLAPVVIVAMVLALLVALGPARRPLHLLIPAFGAVLLTGALSWPLGLGLTPATVAALPVILGLGVDYAVQLQARYWSERAAGAVPATAALAAARVLGPTLLLAGGAMAAGFLALTLSSVPLVDRLGETLAIGVGCCLVTVLLFGPPLLVAMDRRGALPQRLALPQIGLSARARNVALAVVAAFAVAGLAVSGGTSVESDLKKLAPSGMEQLQRVEALERDLGTSGQLRIAVHARDVTDPAVLSWMNRLDSKVLRLDKRLRPGPNLAAILTTGGGGTIPDRNGVQRLLRVVPRYFVAAVLSSDRRLAELSFGIPLLPADEQARLIDRMRPLLADAPAGVRAEPAGLVALAASSVQGLEGGRPWLLLAAALVVFLMLLAARRRLDRAIIPLVPALLAAGTCALLIAATGARLSPLSAALEPLVLAVGVEFGLLLEARYREARRGGSSPSEAARTATETVGAPVAVAATTVALGFAVLVASRLSVLQQFGLLAAVELALCALAAILIVPGLAAALDRRREAGAADERLVAPRVRMTRRSVG